MFKPSLKSSNNLKGDSPSFVASVSKSLPKIGHPDKAGSTYIVLKDDPPYNKPEQRTNDGSNSKRARCCTNCLKAFIILCWGFLIGFFLIGAYLRVCRRSTASSTSKLYQGSRLYSFFFYSYEERPLVPNNFDSILNHNASSELNGGTGDYHVQEDEEETIAAIRYSQLTLEQYQPLYAVSDPTNSSKINGWFYHFLNSLRSREMETSEQDNHKNNLIKVWTYALNQAADTDQLATTTVADNSSESQINNDETKQKQHGQLDSSSQESPNEYNSTDDATTTNKNNQSASMVMQHVACC